MPIIKVDNASFQIPMLQFTELVLQDTLQNIFDVPRYFWH